LKYTINRSKEDLDNPDTIQIYSGEKVFYILKDKPNLVNNFQIKYKNKLYKINEIIQEPFGKFKVEIIQIDKEKTKIEGNTLNIFIQNSDLVENAYIRLYNNCGFYVNTFPIGKKGEVNIDLSPFKKYLVLPLKICVYIPNEKGAIDCLFIGKKNKLKCPFKIFKEVSLHYAIGGRYKYKLPQFKLRSSLPENMKLEKDLFFYLKNLLKIKKYLNASELLKEVEKFLNNCGYCNKEIAKKLINNEKFGKMLNRYFYVGD